MTVAEAFAVIERWAFCRCVCCRAPTDPCKCVVIAGRLFAIEDDSRPVPLTCDDVTAKDRAENRRLKK